MSDIWSLFDKIKKTEKVSGPPEYIIVGLGNPGKDYEKTRHNTGFMALDLISDKVSVHIDRLKFKALTTTAEISGHNVLLMKPQTYMNLSGEAVFAAMDFYKIPLTKVIVVFDDTTLDVGKMRIRSIITDIMHIDLCDFFILGPFHNAFLQRNKHLRKQCKDINFHDTNRPLSNRATSAQSFFYFPHPH